MKKKITYYFSFLFAVMAITSIFSMNSCCEQNRANNNNAPYLFSEPQREEGQKDVIGLRCAPIPTVRIGIIGMGMRGISAIPRLANIEGAEIVAFCDIDTLRVKASNEMLLSYGKTAAKEYCGEESWKKLCEDKEIDLVYICTPWHLHVPMAIYAMENGKHAAMEVPATTSIGECWDLVNTAEKTQRHCMMLENCCYDFFEMATLNMAQQGLFGEIVHCEGAYIHDLRFLNFDTLSTGYQDMWRLKHNITHTGNPYPTHGLGPVAQILNINRGDRMDLLTSMSSNQFGMTEYAKNKFSEESSYAKTAYELGDMNTTIIKTAKGKTIMIQHDVTSPRPYSRLHKVSGTKGYAEKYPRPAIALGPDTHRFLTDEKLDSLLALYEHPITKEIGELAKKIGGHGGMDYIMDYRLIYCLRNGLPLDQDVYDAASWSSIAELSEYSVRNNSAPVKIPDFTRGAWNRRQTYKHEMAE